MKRAALLVVCLTQIALTAIAAEDKPTRPDRPRTKTEERQRFHPRAVGMDAEKRLAGYARRVEMEKTTPFAPLTFRSVGPEVQGGRIVDIVGPKNAPDTLLVAFASGGLWRTENRGGSFSPLFDGESSITLGAIALGDDDGKVIWAGSGEANSSRTSYSGTGIFKSTDAGKTWRNMGLHDTHHIGRIVVDAKNPDVVYVAAMGHLYTENAERGVFKTTDGGATWKRVLFVDEKTGAIDLVEDPSRPGTLYAAMWERDRKAWNFLESGPGSGIWKTTDGGATWKRLTNGFPTGDAVGRIGLAVSRSKPDVVYAVLDNQERRPESEPFDEDTPPGELTARRLKKLSPEEFAELDTAVVTRFLKAYDFPKDLKAAELKADVKKGKTKLSTLVDFMKDANRDLFEREIAGAEVYRSDDGGATWKRTHEGRLDQVFYTYGYYFARIAVSPVDENRVFLPGFAILGSTDGGKTWKGLDQRGVHADQHAFFFDPSSPRRVALGNDGGLNISFDAGETWTKVNNLPVGQFTTVVVDDAEPYNIIGGLQDNGVIRGPSDYVRGKNDPSAWKAIYGGDGSGVQVDPKDRNVVYAALQFGFASRLNLKTNDRTRIRPRPELGEKALRYNWVSPFLISPESRDILWFGTNRLYRSFDRGDDWTAVSEDLTSNREQGNVPFGTITTISESPKKFEVLYVGTDEGKVFGTRDGGVSWNDLGKGLAKDRWVTRVVASAHDEGTVYASQSGYRNDEFTPYLWRSTDYGKTWTSIAAGLPNEPINVVREDPKAKHLLYVGTDLGAYVSVDRGATWNVFTGGLPHVPVHDLAVQPREGDVVLGTHGRSVFVAEAAPLRELTEEARKKDLVAFKVKKAKWERKRGYGKHPYVVWGDKPDTVTLSWWASPAAVGKTTIAVKDAYGDTWKEIAAETKPGFNAVVYELDADPARADAAEAAKLKRTREKAAALEDVEKKLGPKKEKKEGEDDKSDKGSSDSKIEKPPSDAVISALADPLLAKRTRYLAAGTYTVEITANGKTEKTSLELTPPKKDEEPEDEDAATPERD